MKALIATLLGTALVHAAVGDDTAAGTSTIVFDEVSHDFGAVRQHTAHEHTFTFRNNSQAVLKIRRVHASCGCTVARLSRNEIVPGATGEISVALNSQDFKGTVVKHIRVYTNDPQKRTVILRVSANVSTDIACSPMHLNFGEISASDTPALSVKVSSPSGKHYAIESIEPSSDFLEATLEEGAEEHHCIVQVKVAGRRAPARFAGSVTIRTSLPTAPEVRVTVGGSVRARTEVIPPRLYFGLVRDGDRAARTVTIRANSWDGLEVEKVETPDSIDASPEEVEKGKVWVVLVQLKDSLEPGMLKETIRIFVNDPRAPLLTVPALAYLCRDDLSPGQPAPSD